MISHFQNLINSGMNLKDAILKGSLERLSPILMTTLTAGLALVPIALGADEPGKEIEAPMAVVIIGGLFTLTLLNMVVLPALYSKFNKDK